MKIGPKGQVTIPIEIREKLGLFPDTVVEFEILGGKALKIVKARGGRSARGRSIVARLREMSRDGLSTEEIMAMTRG